MASINEVVSQFIETIDKSLDEAFSVLMAFNLDVMSGKAVVSDSYRCTFELLLFHLVQLETYLVGLASWKLNYSSIVSVFTAVTENKTPSSIVSIILSNCKSEFCIVSSFFITSAPQDFGLCSLFHW